MNPNMQPAVKDNFPSNNVFEIPPDSVLNSLVQRFGKRAYVCSFHFMGYKERRDFSTRQWRGENGILQRSPWTDLVLAPVASPKDRPNVSICMDALQRVFMGTDEMTNQKTYREAPITSDEIARDLVRATTGTDQAPPDNYAYPAIWVSSIDEQNGDAFPRTATDRQGRTLYSSDWDSWGTPEFAKKYPKFHAECEAYARRQWNYALGMCTQALAYHSGPQRNPRNINEIHHKSANWVGASPAEHPWMSHKTSEFGALMECPVCGQATSSSHPKCSACGEVINRALYEQTMRELGNIPHQGHDPLDEEALTRPSSLPKHKQKV